MACVLNVAENVDSSEEPTTNSEVVSCRDFGRWLIAMQEDVRLSEIIQGL